MKIYRIATSLRFVSECVGSYSGQLDMVLRAMVGDEQVGYLKYCIYQDQPSVQYLFVDPKFRRQGYGRKLLLQLQSEFPDVEIKTGMATDEGSKLLEHTPSQFFPNTEYEELTATRKALQEQMQAIQLKFDAFYDGTGSSVSQQEASLWQENDQKIWEIDQKLERLAPGKRLFTIAQTKERIRQAAILQDGVVYEGRNHCEIIREINQVGKYKHNAKGQGFVTDTGRFVGRKEAAQIALGCGQIKKLWYWKDELDSADLNYPDGPPTNIKQQAKRKLALSNFPVKTLPKGTLLFHGTNTAGKFTIPDGPAWFTLDHDSAKGWVGWGGVADNRKPGQERVLICRLNHDIELLDTSNRETWLKLAEAATGNPESGGGWVAEALCGAANGWRGRDEVMLCEPAKHLVQQSIVTAAKQPWVTVPRGFNRSRLVGRKGRYLTPEIMEVNCFECGGTGVCPIVPPHVPANSRCTDCKGTGKVLIS